MSGTEERIGKVRKRGGALRRLWRGMTWVAGGPIATAAPQEIASGARFIRGLAKGLRGSGVCGLPLHLVEDGGIDLDATALAWGLSTGELEQLFRQRQRETARAAYLAFGLGWLFFLAWLYRAATMPWNAGRIVGALEFVPFCALFFLAAFRAGLENYRLRARRLVTAGEYLRTAESFWPD